MTAISDPQAQCLQTMTDFTFTVPEEYDRETYADSFHQKYGSEFYSISIFLMEKARNHPPLLISPGMRIRASIVKINKWIPIEECLEFLKLSRALLLGAHGAMLAYDCAKRKIRPGIQVYSFDQEHLLKDDEPERYALPTIGCLYKQWLLLEETDHHGLFDGKAFFCFQNISDLPEVPDRSGDTSFTR